MDFLEVEGVDAFLRVARASNLVMRMDPYVLVHFYGLIFYIDLGELDSKDVSRVFQGLMDKMIIVRKVDWGRSLHEFLKSKLGTGEET